ncbi:MAG: 16S rRNA (adenine(1518)-N(6)/adenine(1519)-N(6))-dimethyltransferase RsmA [Flavobacteriaceae bacterium]|nr:16S rRNA (adenine(1518)-N(6)/adenine(1519)-N(6))-dimethyltransferase RsmA [Flavobacteriaceae bacterium]
MKVRAKKHLGQHFLKDEEIAENIANSLITDAYNDVLEIGPGMGVLTKYLLKKDYNTHVIEIDRDSIAYLETAKKVQKLNINIIEGDFLKVDITALIPNKQFAIIGNFPYNISTQIVFKTLENRHLIPEFSGMFQKEVAERIAEKEGSKKYGILSVLTQAFYDVEYLFTVPPTVFDPPPKVDSGVIRLIRKKNHTLPVDEKLFYRVVKTSFNQRRKMLRGSLKSLNLSDKLREEPIFAMRPEQLSVKSFIELTAKIAQDGISS